MYAPCPRVTVSTCPLASCDDLADDASVHIREPELAALEAIGEAFVVDAEAMQDGGLEVVDVHGVLLGIEAEVVGRP